MQLSASEERLVQRHRITSWKLVRIGWHLCGVIGLGAILLFGGIVVHEIAQRKEYRETMESIRISAIDSLPEGVALVQDYDSPLAFVTDHIQRYQAVIDSLGIAEDILGVQFMVEEMPIGVPGYREYTSTCDLFTRCGCDQDGYFDLLQMEIDPHHNSVRIIASPTTMSRAEYITLNRHSSGIRR